MIGDGVRDMFMGSTNAEKKTGGAEGDRTPGLLDAIQALSQLSYCPANA